MYDIGYFEHHMIYYYYLFQRFNFLFSKNIFKVLFPLITKKKIVIWSDHKDKIVN